MTEPLFLKTVIAVLWDFDNTLIPGNMQAPLFKHYQVVEQDFWDEVKGLEDYYKSQGLQVSPDTLYLNHMLTYVREGRFEGLDNQLLRELGARITFHPGIPQFFGELKAVIEGDQLFRPHQISVEHYVISTGLRQMILGSSIAEHVDGVWACEFVENPAPVGYLKSGMQQVLALPKGGRNLKPARPGRRTPAPSREISQIVFQIDNTTKTRAVFEINKGTNKNPAISVNAQIAAEARRVPFKNMVYIADGPSDIPVYSILNQYSGKTFAVYDPKSEAHFTQVYKLQEQERVRSFGPADFTPGSHTYRWIVHTARQIAERIVLDRERALEEQVQPPPGHIEVEPDARPEKNTEGPSLPDEVRDSA